MLYTELTKKAMRVAFDVHKGQTDKSGLPYIYHPMHLAEQMPDEATVCAALLHDTVEDGGITLDDLREQGFSEDIVGAVALLTHDDRMPYTEYVQHIGQNSIAKAVKLADLRHNSDLSRLAVVDEKALARYEKYQAAIALLEGNDSPA